VRDQEAAVQQTFHLMRNSFFYPSPLMVGTQHRFTSLHFLHSCTKQRTWLLSSRSEAMSHGAILSYTS